ncbi:hypothetical protein Manayef4_03950 [Frankia sp. CgMI4]|uniref:hypothetical protein n=1 Tax=Frankia sp. CgMI4 TaxID=1742262 RepID=UPI000871FA07|nr:hypothetical protein [Frankia sp. CgIM4]OFB39309.1 hypothetical protein Manayef4_03950 [Frankia sp. CgIM4]
MSEEEINEKATKETDEEFEARRKKEFNEGMRNARTFSTETLTKAKEDERKEDEERRKRIFGDKKPTLYVDRYTDL